MHATSADRFHICTKIVHASNYYRAAHFTTERLHMLISKGRYEKNVQELICIETKLPSTRCILPRARMRDQKNIDEFWGEEDDHLEQRLSTL